MAKVIIHYTSPGDGDSFVHDDDSVVTDDVSNEEAVVIHDGETVRVDLQNTGKFQINTPYFVEIQHKYFEGTWAGWGWRAEINGASKGRDPTSRAIGVYNDSEWTAYLYTTGAFVEQVSEWQTDDAGNSVRVWATETPAGYAKPDKEQWNLALLKGSAQEVRTHLLATEDSTTMPYFDTEPELEVRGRGKRKRKK